MEHEYNKSDCTFQYFKPSGKWAYEGRGVFPTGDGYFVVDHDAIHKANNGMPGITGNGKHMIVVVLPDEDCNSDVAFPRMIKAVE